MIVIANSLWHVLITSLFWYDHACGLFSDASLPIGALILACSSKSIAFFVNFITHHNMLREMVSLVIGGVHVILELNELDFIDLFHEHARAEEKLNLVIFDLLYICFNG